MQVILEKEAYLLSKKDVRIFLRLGLRVESAETVSNQLCAVGDPHRNNNQDDDGRDETTLCITVISLTTYQIDSVGEGQHTRSNTSLH